MSTKLYYQPGDPDYLKIVLVNENLKIPVERFTAVEEHAPERAQSDLKDNLVLEITSGEYLTSANEICRYLCSLSGDVVELTGSSSEEEAEISSWLEWEERKLKNAVQTVVGKDSKSDELHSCLSELEKTLSSGSQYIVNAKLSLADVVVWSTLFVVFAPEGTTMQALQKTFPSLAKWFVTLTAQKSFSTSVKKASSGQGFERFREFLMARTTQGNLHGLSGSLISADETHEASAAWSKGPQGAPKPTKLVHPILPVPGKRNVLITSALPYVNNVPHLGNIIGCVLSADVFARYCRLRNYNTLYICGTDEYGTATETKALEEGLTPQEICAKYFAIHDEVYHWFNIEFDYFGRTSTPQQTEIAQDIFWRLQKNGYIIQDRVQQLYCQNCQRFLADRFVEGTCPLCNYEDARGDQCDKCSRLINTLELKNPRCKICSKEPQVKSSDHLFLDLTKLQENVKVWSEESAKTGVWSPNAQYTTSSWIRDGLKPRCISRDLKWGTPVPMEGYTDKVFYVWFDAPIGYLSITACYTEQWEKWWKNPKEVELYQYMAKDNVPFHTVVFPCSLIGTGDNYTLLNHISATEYLNYENGKFSKSRGVGVFGDNAKETNIPADIYRFYLLFIRPETQDTVFSWADFVLKHNTELLNNLGNFIYRCLTFLRNNFSGTIPEVKLTPQDLELVVKVTRELKAYISCLERQKIRDGLKHVLAISRLGNGYVQTQAPWKLVKGTPEEVARAGSLMGLCANVVCLLSVMAHPYMPTVSKQVQEQLQAPVESMVLVDSFIPFLQPGHTIAEPYPLFVKIDEETSKALKERFSGKQKGSNPAEATK